MIRLLLAAFLLLAPAVAARAQTTLFRVTLLGTGTPVPSAERFGNSTLIEAGTTRLLVDFGRGVSIRLWQLHIPLGSITAHFLTHFHSDHTGGLPDLWLTGWLRPPYGQRNTPFVLYGPPGTEDMARNLTQAFAKDIVIREVDEHDPPEGIAFDAHDVMPGPVYEHDGVRVIAFANDHGINVKPSYGYRVEYAGHVVVLSGDTRYDPDVVRQAQGADLFLHAVTFIPPALLAANPAYNAIYAHLASPADVARAFAEAKPKMAALTHVGLNGNATEDDLLRAVRAGYDGPLVIGEDLMAFDIGTTVTAWQRARP
jgi:ribonuclease Z